MSYLNALRLHFAGQFQANVSTVNNDPGHFDNATFLPSYQDMEGPGMNPPNGWFNPEGDGSWRLRGCLVTAAWTPDGAVPASDPVLACAVADADNRAPAKLVDLDPEQQLVSQIWGLQVRIADGAGNTLLRGEFAAAAFADIWTRAIGAGGAGDIGAAAMYQSVLTELEWGKVSASPFLTALQAASAASGKLSIKFNIDGINLDFSSPDFMCGRLVGTIGPCALGEPEHMVVGRQFMAANQPGNQSFFAPVGGINFCAAVVDAAAGMLYLDLGNALSTKGPGGPLSNLGNLAVGVYDPATTGKLAGFALRPIGGVRAALYAGDSNWYRSTAGVLALPIAADLLGAVQTMPLAIIGTRSNAAGGQIVCKIAEWPNGVHVRPDGYVHRLNPPQGTTAGDSAELVFQAAKFGEPFAGAQLTVDFDPSQLQPSNSIDPNDVPQVGEPTAAVQGPAPFPVTLTTNAAGQAVLTVRAGDPGTPRWFNNGKDYGIDGQVYGLRASFADPALETGPTNAEDFVSLLVWSSYAPAQSPPTWDDVLPIMQQYANLYPVMLRFLDMASMADVLANARLLKLAFGLPMSDPNHMPVTRDLSATKRAMILAWLDNPLPGTARAPQVEAPAAAEPMAFAPPAAQHGGKAAAMARRLSVQSAAAPQ